MDMFVSKGDGHIASSLLGSAHCETSSVSRRTCTWRRPLPLSSLSRQVLLQKAVLTRPNSSANTPAARSRIKQLHGNNTRSGILSRACESFVPEGLEKSRGARHHP